jgi:beta-mannanase
MRIKMVNFNQKYEPKGNKIIHGAGQSLETFSNYWKAVENNKPQIYMTYAKIPKIHKWIEKIKIEAKKYPNLMLQIGLKLLDADGKDKTADVLSGKYDQDLDDFFEAIKELGNSSFIRIGYEFDKKGKYNAKNFVKAWKYIVNRFRKARIENIATVWCACPFNGTEPVEQYYPGDGYVDWFGIDVFYARHLTGEYKPVEDFLKLAKKHKKPVMVGETTSAEVGVLDGKKSWDNWYKPFFKWIGNHKQIKAFCYINWDWAIHKTWGSPGTWGDCRIEKNEIVRKNYIKELSNQEFIHNKT